jgi:hypothetical protein
VGHSPLGGIILKCNKKRTVKINTSQYAKRDTNDIEDFIAKLQLKPSFTLVYDLF